MEQSAECSPMHELAFMVSSKRVQLSPLNPQDNKKQYIIFIKKKNQKQQKIDFGDSEEGQGVRSWVFFICINCIRFSLTVLRMPLVVVQGRNCEASAMNPF